MIFEELRKFDSGDGSEISFDSALHVVNWDRNCCPHATISTFLTSFSGQLSE